ncbi:MAG TPA: SCO family protein [Candidatus Dormibacteraeota bacterium]|nr:SCO family protein [Candidatus Dormibacteraeota bacterium]
MRLALLAVIVTVLAACGSGTAFTGTAFSPARPAPDFTLVDQAGRNWSLASQRGTSVALYFGYTHCLDECPLTVAKLARAIAALPSGDRAEVVFVTVDPQRDTPRVLAAFVRRFRGATVVGLTGTHRALARVYAAYHVWEQRIPGRARRGGYAVAHASPVFLIDDRGMLRVLHDDGDARSAFVHDLRELNG